MVLYLPFSITVYDVKAFFLTSLQYLKNYGIGDFLRHDKSEKSSKKSHSINCKSILLIILTVICAIIAISGCLTSSHVRSELASHFLHRGGIKEDAYHINQLAAIYGQVYTSHSEDTRKKFINGDFFAEYSNLFQNFKMIDEKENWRIPQNELTNHFSDKEIDQLAIRLTQEITSTLFVDDTFQDSLQNYWKQVLETKQSPQIYHDRVLHIISEYLKHRKQRGYGIMTAQPAPLGDNQSDMELIKSQYRNTPRLYDFPYVIVAQPGEIPALMRRFETFLGSREFTSQSAMIQTALIHHHVLLIRPFEDYESNLLYLNLLQNQILLQNGYFPFITKDLYHLNNVHRQFFESLRECESNPDNVKLQLKTKTQFMNWMRMYLQESVQSEGSF